MAADFRLHRMLEYSLDGHNVSLSAIRTVRVLRPLRAINRVPSKFVFPFFPLSSSSLLDTFSLIFFSAGTKKLKCWLHGKLVFDCLLVSHSMFSLARFAPCFFSAAPVLMQISGCHMHSVMETSPPGGRLCLYLNGFYSVTPDTGQWMHHPFIHLFFYQFILVRVVMEREGQGKWKDEKKNVTPMNPLVNVKGTINLISLSFRCKTRSAPRGPPNTQRHFGRCFALILITSKPFWSNITATSATVVSTW